MLTRFLLRRDTTLAWQTANPVLQPGEPGYDHEKLILKIGDGKKRWTELEGFASASASLDDVPAALREHILSDNPHPVYDDGPSLFLLYENAKV